jgi:flagellar basal body-associated protein FliL
VNGKAFLLIFLVAFAAVATSFVLWSSNTQTSEGFSFNGSHDIVQVFDEVEPTGIEMDHPGMPG